MDYDNFYSLNIVARHRGRRRPIYLAAWQETVDGNYDYDAFHTLAEAKRWCLAVCGRKRATWVEHKDDGGHAFYWSAVVEQK